MVPDFGFGELGNAAGHVAELFRSTLAEPEFKQGSVLKRVAFAILDDSLNFTGGAPLGNSRSGGASREICPEGALRPFQEIFSPFADELRQLAKKETRHVARMERACYG